MPALLTSTSRPFSAASASRNSFATCLRSDTSQVERVIVGIAFGELAQRGLVHVAHMHARAFRDERARDLEPDAARAGRDQDFQVLDAEIHVLCIRRRVHQSCSRGSLR